MPPLLQPVAHALLQAHEDAARLVRDLPEERLWLRPSGVASAGFHLQHVTGVVDRLCTYARGEALSDAQLAALAVEGERPASGGSAGALIDAFGAQVERALEQLRATDESTLTDARAVGRKKLPSTVIGLLFHAAEHAQRHVGQLLVTVRLRGAHDA